MRENINSHLYCQPQNSPPSVLCQTMSSKGIKRASPGAEEEKNPLGDVELSDEDAGKLQVLQKDTARVELALGASYHYLVKF